VTICSSIPRLAQTVQELIPSLTVQTIDPPLDRELAQRTDFLIAEHNVLGPLLQYGSEERLQFVQNTWAGVDSLVRSVQMTGSCPTLPMARFSHPAFSQLMAEYCLVSVISMERSFPHLHSSQAKKEWNLSAEVRNYRSLSELTVGILGVGQMGKTTAKIFKGLGSRVLGLVNSDRPGDQWVERYFTRDSLGELLSLSDYVLNMLPATPETDGILGGGILSQCKGAGLVNIGRGNVYTEDDLLDALSQGWVKGAYLDVFSVEPLPKESPLWSHPAVMVTPHLAGESRALDIAQCFRENLERHDEGKEINCLVDWEKFY